jgi:hypothetical protein
VLCYVLSQYRRHELFNLGTLAFFAEKFNMTPSETVALMGAHNLGLANISTSGFSGQWVLGQGGKLSNQYYKILVENTKWMQV